MRWTEKLGQPSSPRPEGTLIWFHAVGLGEVMALRGLIIRLANVRPDLHFLVTSTARASGEVFCRNLPPRTIHQFLPLDLPRPVRAFLNHWRPDLAVWSEQDLWPRLVTETAGRGVVQALINGRMNDAALAARRRFSSAYGDLYARFSLLMAQDDRSAENIRLLGAGAQVIVTGSLKSGAATLSVESAKLDAARAAVGFRPIWLAGPTHEEDEAMALNAHVAWRQAHPGGLLILVPRQPERSALLAAACTQRGLSFVSRSRGETPSADTDVWIADTFGEFGLWYRLASVALIGGSFGLVEGHNPWEAAALDCTILHGPRTANFAADYAALDDAGAAIIVGSDADIAAALARHDLRNIALRARTVQAHAAQVVTLTADALLELLP
jgi:3-deoxy-D-manno-octulosonic-acid transferase